MYYEYSEDAPLPPAEDPPPDGVGLRNIALAYGHMGLAILPIRNGTKKANPEELGGIGYKVSDAGIRNLDRINDIWTRNCGTCIGIVTGQPNRLLVIDIDRKRGGPDPIKALAAWEAETGIEIPNGPTVITPGGSPEKSGMHIYLSLPPGTEPLSSVRGWLPNIDIQCEGSYVIAPPSYRLVKTQIDGECPHERETGRECLDSQCPSKVTERWAMYEWADTMGSPYSPTPAEWLTDLEASVAPVELIEDIRRWGRTRSQPKELRHITQAARSGLGGGAGGGLEAVKYYREHGIPTGMAQWDVLYYDMTWSLMNAGLTPEQIVAILREVVDHPGTELSRPWEPWETGDETDGKTGQSLWAIVNRAFARREMDGDDYYQAKRAKQIEADYAKHGDLVNLSIFRKRSNDSKGTAK